ncbi:MAG: hypothetical protein H6732_13490 [Alphaproteobacteria bacterium]|nr:hypothetical protein [Alphaproteobacteria bacterium]
MIFCWLLVTLGMAGGDGTLVLTEGPLLRVVPEARALPLDGDLPRTADLRPSLPPQGAPVWHATAAWALARLTLPRDQAPTQVAPLAASLEAAYVAEREAVALPDLLREVAVGAAEEALPRRSVERLRRVEVHEAAEVLRWLAAGVPLILGARVDAGWAQQSRARWRPEEGPGQARVLMVVGYVRGGAELLVQDALGQPWAHDGTLRVDTGALLGRATEGYVVRVVPTAEAEAGDPSADDPRVDLGMPDITQSRQREPRWPPSVQLSATATLPPYLGREAVVAVRAFHPGERKGPGAAIPALQERFADGLGQAAAVGLPLALGEQAALTWTGWMPYDTLDVAGTGVPPNTWGYFPKPARILLVPTLYVDGFPVASGSPVAVDVLR